MTILNLSTSFTRCACGRWPANGGFAVVKVPKAMLSRSVTMREKKSEEEDLDRPIKFTTSQAAQWKATASLGGNPFPDAPSYQPYVVSLSIGIFLLYFLALREESDIDEEMEKPLWQRVPGLEKQQLHLVLEYNRNHNLGTSDIEERIRQIELEEAGRPNNQSKQ